MMDSIAVHLRSLCRPLLDATPEERLRWCLKLLAWAAVLAAAAFYVSQNWRLLWDRQIRKCMDVNMLLFHASSDPQIRRGDVVVFAARNAAPVFPDGTRLAKIAAGVPGDLVEITAEEKILINGRLVAEGLPYLDQVPAESRYKFFGRRVLRSGEYWMMGTTDRSFDSRYWGSIHASQVLGKAWVLF